MRDDAGATPAGPLVDPWRDACVLRRHVHRPGAELVVVLGAQGWCGKCRHLRARFETLCQAGLPEHVLALWLDLEDHAEFLGGFVPPDLPLLLRWRAGQCIQAALVQDIDPVAVPPEPRVCLQGLTLAGDSLLDPNENTLLALPPLWAVLGQGDWAVA